MHKHSKFQYPSIMQPEIKYVYFNTNTGNVHQMQYFSGGFYKVQIMGSIFTTYFHYEIDWDGST